MHTLTQYFNIFVLEIVISVMCVVRISWSDGESFDVKVELHHSLVSSQLLSIMVMYVISKKVQEGLL